jgi:radical SAM superfamily enzyme YgiQ (UPF0313 family)
LWNLELSLHLAYLIKRVLPEVCIVLGGPSAGPCAAELLDRHDYVDLIIDGDGEEPFLALVRHFLAGPNSELGSVPSLRYRAGTEVVRNAGASVANLSSLVGVYEELPKQSDLDRDWQYPYLTFETMRGCPYSCSYCMYGRAPVTAKEPAAVVRELVPLLRAGLNVALTDPTFTTYQRRAKEILRGLAEHEYSGCVTLEAYPDSIDVEMADLLAAARVSLVGMGLQTLSSKGLKEARRPENIVKFERAVRLLQERSVKFYVDVIYGLPRTTADDFIATIEFLNSLDVFRIEIYRLLGLPGTPMMDDVESHGLVFNEQPPYELLVSDAFSLEDIVYCGQFRVVYFDALWRLGKSHFRRFAALAGGTRAFVQLVLDSGGPGRPEALGDATLKAMGVPADRVASVGPLRSTSRR